MYYNRNRDKKKRSEMRSHDEFLELCAVSTSGDLGDEERKKLLDHLAVCLECRQALKEFEAVIDVGVPLLSSELGPIPSECSNLAAGEFPETATAKRTRIDSETNREVQDGALIAARRSGHARTHVNWNYVWVSPAFC
jgi:hypothetical protein